MTIDFDTLNSLESELDVANGVVNDRAAKVEAEYRRLLALVSDIEDEAAREDSREEVADRIGDYAYSNGREFDIHNDSVEFWTPSTC